MYVLVNLYEKYHTLDFHCILEFVPRQFTDVFRDSFLLAAPSMYPNIAVFETFDAMFSRYTF